MLIISTIQFEYEMYSRNVYHCSIPIKENALYEGQWDIISIFLRLFSQVYANQQCFIHFIHENFKIESMKIIIKLLLALSTVIILQVPFTIETKWSSRDDKSFEFPFTIETKCNLRDDKAFEQENRQLAGLLMILFEFICDASSVHRW